MAGTYRKYDEEKQVSGETRSDPDWYPQCRKKRSSRPGSAGNLVRTTEEENQRTQHSSYAPSGPADERPRLSVSVVCRRNVAAVI